MREINESSSIPEEERRIMLGLLKMKPEHHEALKVQSSKGEAQRRRREKERRERG